ncbi:glycosyltransferase family 2 protein [Flavobacterium sp. GT2N3]|uniref:glycosyltransferase family 2 protein n=1 Tax=Flavobacterium sp. GT2N3 TaxID=3401733 RepID=UPI003AAE7F77
MEQTFTDFELLAIDDGSTDGSVAVIKSFNDKRIHLITLEHNFIASLNYGLKISKGKFIARMDADDIMLPNRLQIQHDFMERKFNVDICANCAESFGNTCGTMQ